MAQTSRRSNGRSSAPKRKWVWARVPLAGSATADAVVSDALSEFRLQYGADILGSTIMRLRGRIGVQSDTTVPASLVMGVRTYTQEVGAPSIPSEEGPVTQPTADWMLYEPFPFTSFSTGIFTIDSQASRKMEELGQGLLVAFEPSTGGSQWTWDGVLSVGFKLP